MAGEYSSLSPAPGRCESFGRGMIFLTRYPRGATFNIVCPNRHADSDVRVSNNVENGTSIARGLSEDFEVLCGAGVPPAQCGRDGRTTMRGSDVIRLWGSRPGCRAGGRKLKTQN